jgi:hypothetical protein
MTGCTSFRRPFFLYDSRVFARVIGDFQARMPSVICFRGDLGARLVRRWLTIYRVVQKILGD